MNRETILAAMATVPAWAIARRQWDAMIAALSSGLSVDDIRAAFGRSVAAAGERNASPRLAVIGIRGVLDYRPSVWSWLFGGSSAMEIGAQLHQAAGDPQVGAILLDVDSPGGSVEGMTELAARIRQARARKPLVAVANPLAASAAYWLASGAGEVVATPSGELGSIGVFTGHTDLSEAMRKLGMRTTLIAAGRHKTEGNPYEPLSDDAREHMQSMVDDYYAQFTEDVALGRGRPVREVRGEAFGEGRLFTARRAVEAGLADRLGTFDDELRRLTAVELRKDAAVIASSARHRIRSTARRAEVEQSVQDTAARRARSSQ